MQGFKFTETWDSVSKNTNSRVQIPKELTASFQYQAERFHAAPFEPAYIMEQGFGDQNSATLPPNMANVPAHGGIFGPLFGTIRPGGCAGMYGVGPISDVAPHHQGLMRGSARNSAFPDPLSGRCPPVASKPYKY